MNKDRRKQIKKAINGIRDLVQGIYDEEQDAYDNMPEGLQESANGLNSLDAQDSLDLAIECLEEAICHLEDID